MTRHVIDRAHVDAAVERVRPHVRRTPLVELELGGTNLWAKLEHIQHSGSFKFRGAINRLLVADPSVPVVAASGGNHGIAVALAGARLQRHVSVFLPSTAPEPKKAAIRAAGAELIEAGTFYADAEAAAREELATMNALFVHPYDDHTVAAGQGTCLAETLVQHPELEHWVVAVGGGGLLAGSLAAGGGAVRVSAVEPAGAPTLTRAIEADRPVRVDIDTVCSSALGAAVVSATTLEMVRKTQSDVVLVSDDEILEAQHLLWRDYRILVEPAGAAALAAVITHRIDSGPDTCVLLCGANTDQLPTQARL